MKVSLRDKICLIFYCATKEDYFVFTTSIDLLSGTNKVSTLQSPSRNPNIL